MVGYGAGAVIGGILSGGNPAAISLGAQTGQQLVAGMQSLWRAITDNTEEMRRPRAETLRDQIGSTITRGTFAQAAHNTYYVENTVNFQSFIPSREGMRQAIAAIKQEWDTVQDNFAG